MAGKHGANQLDVSALSCEQQQTLRHFKIKTRIANESYLMSHPEVDVMVGDFVRKVLLQRPTDIREFAADYFTNPNLHTSLVSKMKEGSDTE
nr:RIIa domain-containing protein 1 [Solea senegalensis]